LRLSPRSTKGGSGRGEYVYLLYNSFSALEAKQLFNAACFDCQFTRLDSLKKDAEEENRKKMEAFNEVMLRKEKERQEREDGPHR
jgi:hypothetical protein